MDDVEVPTPDVRLSRRGRALSPYRVRYIFYGLGLALLLSTVLSTLAVAVVVIPTIDTDAIIATGGFTDEVFADLNTAVLDAATSPVVIIASLIGLWAGLAGVPWWASRRRGSRSLATDFWWQFNWRRDIVIGLAFGVGLRIATVLLGAAAAWLGLPLEGADNTGFLLGHGILVTLLLAVLVFVGAPIVEELFFRGLALQSLTRRWGTVVGVVGSSVLFGFLHVQGWSVGSAFLIAMTGAVGAVLAVMTLRTRRMGPAVLTHVVFNLTGVLAVLLLPA